MSAHLNIALNVQNKIIHLYLFKKKYIKNRNSVIINQLTNKLMNMLKLGLANICYVMDVGLIQDKLELENSH